METYLKNILSSHPIDWIIHFVLCFIPIFFDWSLWFVVLFVCILIEYEQKSQIWYNHFSWQEYLFKHSLGDLIAGSFGIICGLTINYFFK